MKKRIITSALALALAFSLCACTDNTSTTESYSDSTSGTTASGKSSFEQSGDSVLLPESLPETSKSNQADEDVEIINIYDYIPVGYVDEAQRYFLIQKNSDNALNDYTCDYVVYDDREKKAVYCFTVGGYYDPVSESQPFDSDVKYSEGMFSFSAWNYYVDTDECERWYEVTDVYGNLIDKSTTSKTQISHCTYVPSDDKVYYNASVNDECCFYKMNSDGSNKDKLLKCNVHYNPNIFELIEWAKEDGVDLTSYRFIFLDSLWNQLNQADKIKYFLLLSELNAEVVIEICDLDELLETIIIRNYNSKIINNYGTIYEQ